MSELDTLSFPSIQYTIWAADLHGHRFHVKLRIQDPALNGQVLQMPAWIPGSYLIRDFSKQIETISAYAIENPNHSLELERINNDQWRLPNVSGPVEILTTVYAFDSSVRASYLDTERAFINASSLCFSIKGQELSPCALILVPPKDASAVDWTVQTSLRAVKTDDQGYGFYLAKNYDDLIDHPIALGEFQIAHWISNGTPQSMAIRWRFKAAFMKSISNESPKICRLFVRALLIFLNPKQSRLHLGNTYSWSMRYLQATEVLSIAIVQHCFVGVIRSHKFIPL